LPVACEAESVRRFERRGLAERLAERNSHAHCQDAERGSQ
jgi:hypothetical protein